MNNNVLVPLHYILHDVYNRYLLEENSWHVFWIADGSPVKNLLKDNVKKIDNITASKGGNVAPSSVTSSAGVHVAQQQQQATASQPQKPDEPTDCYLQDLYTQVTSVVATKPDEKENANEGKDKF